MSMINCRRSVTITSGTRCLQRASSALRRRERRSPANKARLKSNRLGRQDVVAHVVAHIQNRGRRKSPMGKHLGRQLEHET